MRRVPMSRTGLDARSAGEVGDASDGIVRMRGGLAFFGFAAGLGDSCAAARFGGPVVLEGGRDAVATCLLCLVHRFVGAGDERVDVVRVVFGERGSDPFGDAGRVGRIGDVFEHDHELVAANSCDRVAGTCLDLEAACDGAQEPITGRVAVLVIHRLEPVQVTETQSDVAAGSGGAESA